MVSWSAFVVAILMAHENGDKQRPTKRQHMQGMLDEIDLLIICEGHYSFFFTKLSAVLPEALKNIGNVKSKLKIGQIDIHYGK